MLKKILIVLLILAPSALYLYIVSRDGNKTPEPAVTAPADQKQTEQYQTPDH
ncbi:hypothetical protein [Acinetobacter thermotolerans]|uniref:hypothetical protein n=1 Tax=Acinetobacter thermotolerans TaxID=3151487 RepID=UPI00325A4ED8